MHLITKLINFFKMKKIIHIITNILPSGMCVCCNIGRSYRIGGVNMIGKGYFKVDFYLKSMVEATKFVEAIEDDKDLSFNVKLQAIHSESKVLVVTFQIRNGVNVNRLIGWLDDFKHYGYCVWLSKEDDFFAVSDCKCHLTMNQLSQQVKKKVDDEAINSDEIVKEEENGNN